MKIDKYKNMKISEIVKLDKEKVKELKDLAWDLYMKFNLAKSFQERD